MTTVITLAIMLLLAGLLYWLYVLANKLGREDRYFTNHPAQGFWKLVTRGVRPIRLLMEEPNYYYNPEKDEIIYVKDPTKKPNVKKSILAAFLIWLGDLIWMGFEDSYGVSQVRLNWLVLKDAAVSENTITDLQAAQNLCEGYTKDVTELPLVFNAAYLIEKADTKGNIYGFFLLNVLFKIEKPMLFWSLLRAGSDPVTGAFGEIAGYAKMYSGKKTIDEIREEDTETNTGKNGFLATIKRAKVKKFGLKIDLVSLVATGTADSEEVVLALKQQQLEELKGKAKVITAKYDKNAAKLQAEAKKLLYDQEVAFAEELMKKGSSHDYQSYQFGHSDLQTLVINGGSQEQQTQVSIPVGSNDPSNGNNNSGTKKQRR